MHISGLVVDTTTLHIVYVKNNFWKMEEDEEGDFQKVKFLHLYIKFLLFNLFLMLTKVVSVCSEESLLQKASKEIDQIVSSRSAQNDPVVEGKPTAHSLLRARLQNQVCTGEITPFQKERSEIDDNKKNGSVLIVRSRELVQCLQYVTKIKHFIKKTKQSLEMA